MELSKNNEIRKFNDAGQRPRIPAEMFKIPGKSIADVQFKGNEYIVRDAGNRQVCRLHTLVYGELQGNGSDFLVFKKGSSFQICDTMGKNGVKQIEQVVGQFRGVSGQYITFEKGGSIYTYDRYFRRVSPPRLANY
jgi:hypothetical protein